MKIYTNTEWTKKIRSTPDNEIDRIVRDIYNQSYEDSCKIQYMGLYMDAQGKVAHKYKMVYDDGTVEINYVDPTKGHRTWVNDICNYMSPVAQYMEGASAFPKKPKNTPSTSYKIAKSINIENDYGDEVTFDIITSKSSAMAFLYNELWNIGLPIMQQSILSKDEYIERMQECEERGLDIDEDTITHFMANGIYYAIDDDTTLSKAIEMYYAVPNVESLLQTNAWCDVLYKSHIYKDDDGYWYSDLGEPQYPDEEYAELIRV